MFDVSVAELAVSFLWRQIMANNILSFPAETEVKFKAKFATQEIVWIRVMWYKIKTLTCFFLFFKLIKIFIIIIIIIIIKSF